ncbi:AraC family transcriptional regulator [Caballeronia arationis]|jgi:AraC-like DNA-binding protein|uniref:AraC-type DNA-binding protein n=2 Tax=Caballeronia arationis TaxID=1777142 RepID=A0A7Z7N0I2_9BURK|nr:AraC family transcriptional regulator [Caballeronia arationis]SOE51807.1 AraC-type DNA-binding protein [Caballeronia arationis]
MAGKKRRNTTEFARFGHVDSIGMIEALHARFEDHRFAAHAHDTWSIGAVVAGAKDISAKKGSQQVFGANQVYCIPPESPHAGKTIGGMCEYVMLYVPDEAWRQQCEAFDVDVRQFTRELPADTQQVRLTQAFVNQIIGSPETVDVWSGEWSLSCESLLGEYRGSPLSKTTSSSRVRTDPGLHHAYECLHEFWNRNVSLQDLSREFSMTASDVCRRFSLAYGLTPHRYELVLRLTKAKSRLLEGVEISDVASETGFADQSHFGRHFKSIFGVTPGAVAKAGHLTFV